MPKTKQDYINQFHIENNKDRYMNSSISWTIKLTLKDNSAPLTEKVWQVESGVAKT